VQSTTAFANFKGLAVDVAILAAQAVLPPSRNKTRKSSTSSPSGVLERSYVKAAPVYLLLRMTVNTVSPRTNMKAWESRMLFQGELLDEVRRA
jgi:hypothetical protein